MAWAPISGTIPQYQKANGDLASGYYLKFYQDGTTTAFNMATDSSGGTTLDKCEIDSSGYPTTDGTTRFIPHVDQDYKIILYKNSADADANTTGSAEWIIDSVSAPQGIGETLNTSQLTYNASGITGFVNRGLNDRLTDYVLSTDFGCTTDLTDPSSDNHVKLKNAAIEAVKKNAPLVIVGKVLVSSPVDFDTRGSSFNGLDPLVGDGVQKNFSIIGDAAGSGIFGLASAFSGGAFPNSVVTYSALSTSEISGVRFAIYDPTSVYTWATFTNTILLHCKTSDRIDVNHNNIGGIIQPGGATLQGAGICLWFENCMSARADENDIAYYTRYGIASDDGTALDTLAMTETKRVMTSCAITRNHFAGGRPSGTSRDQCVSVLANYGYYLDGNIFENNDVARAIVTNSDNNVFVGNWFEGTYDTVLLRAGFGHQFYGSLDVQFAPTNGVIEGYHTYSVGGSVAVGASDASTLLTCIFQSPGFYTQGCRIGAPLDVRGDFSTSAKITGGSCAFDSDSSDTNGIIGATTYPVINDQCTMSIHNPVTGTSRLRLSSAGDPTTTSNYLVDYLCNPSDANNGLVIDVNQDKRLNIQIQGADGYYFYYGTLKQFSTAGDNAATLGAAGNRWSVVYAATGTINTSDEREKTEILEIEQKEKLCAKEVKKCIGKFRFKDAVEEKGENARIHFGVGAQTIKAIFEKHDLSPAKYALFCHDKWDDEYEDVIKEREYIKENGQKGVEQYKTGEKILKRKAGDRYGIRYEELLCFIIAAM